MRLLVIFILVIQFALEAYSHGNIKSNYEIMDSISNDCVNSLVSLIHPKIELHTFFLEFSDLINNGSNNYFENKIIKSLPLNKILSHKDTSEIVISFRIEDFSVQYEQYEPSQDSLFRKINLYAVTIYSNGIIKKIIYECDLKYLDIISRDDVVFVERTSQSFSKAPVPDRKKSIFEKVLQPVIYVSAVLITVLILFTVRSN